MAQNLGDLFLSAENGFTDDLNECVINNDKGATIVSSEKAFGENSFYFTGGGSFSVSGKDFNLGSDDFTIDFWIKPNSILNQNIMAKTNDGNVYNGWAIFIHEYLNMQVGTGTNQTILTGTTDYTNASTFTHVAITRNGNNWYLFENGILVDTYIGYIDVSMNQGDTPMVIGRVYYSTYAHLYTLDGYMDNIRFVKNQALWTEEFELNEIALYYQSIKIPTSKIYDISHKGNLRGKTKEGFVRPTLKQFFTSTDWEEIEKN